jgi:hypothetical protein
MVAHRAAAVCMRLKRCRACRFIGVTEIQGRAALVMKYYRLGSLANAVEHSCGGLLPEQVLRSACWCGVCWRAHPGVACCTRAGTGQTVLDGSGRLTADNCTLPAAATLPTSWARC